MKNYLFEVCTNSVESCIAAQEGGANRVELCAGIPEGGTTPSYGEIAMAREVLTTTRLHVIIRPRGGDFLYSGQQATAELGIPLLKELRERANGRITLLAGCGVNEKNICRIAKETGIQEFHFSARESIKSGMEYKNEAVSMGGTVHISEYERNVTTVKRVKDTIESITSSL